MFSCKQLALTHALLCLALLSGSNVCADSDVNLTETDSQQDPAATLSYNLQKHQQSSADFSDFGGANTQEDSNEMWLALRELYFLSKPIIESGENRISIIAPARAENDAMVPVDIELKKNDNALDPFQKVYLIVDVNPIPLGGLFTLANNRQMEQIKTSVRVNGYTYIRAVGETKSGKLYMAKQWVKSTGAGCSAPPGLDQEMHKKRLGKIRFSQIEYNDEDHSRSLRLIVSHPNNTGMQKDQLSTLFIPEHYITDVKVTFNDELVLKAETSFTLSENPNFTFTFDPEESGTLRADFTDNEKNYFSLETFIKGQAE